MREQISWWVELAIKPGQLGNFQSLTGEMVEAAQAEQGVLSYQRFISDDSQVVHVYERYVNSSAALAHLRRFIEVFSDRFASMANRRRFTVLGNPSDELKLVLDQYGAIYCGPFGPFNYWAWRRNA
jgi:quinol monooxygenase YgiN